MQKDILFQKIVDRWYAFVELDGEVYSTVLPKGIDPRSSKFDLAQIIDMANSNKKGPIIRPNV